MDVGAWTNSIEVNRVALHSSSASHSDSSFAYLNIAVFLQTDNNFYQIELITRLYIEIGCSYYAEFPIFGWSLMYLKVCQIPRESKTPPFARLKQKWTLILFLVCPSSRKSIRKLWNSEGVGGVYVYRICSAEV